MNNNMNYNKNNRNNKDNDNKLKLIIMVGISASGKSTIAKQLAEKENAIIVSSDAIRAELCDGNMSNQSKNDEVFKIYHKRIRSNLLNGNNVIADATNITIRSRRTIFNAVNGIDCEKIGYIVVKKIKNCIEDNHNNDRVAVPDYVIEKQVKKFQILFKEEGFDDIIIDDQSQCIIETFLLPSMEFYVTMIGFDQKNPNHNQTLDKHCDYVEQMFKQYNYPYCYNLAAKLHDIGKYYVQSFDENGIAHYFSHENYGTYLLLSNYKSFIYSHELMPHKFLDLLFLVNYHMLPMNWTTDKVKEKWRKIFGDYKYQLLLDFHECDKMQPE